MTEQTPSQREAQARQALDAERESLRLALQRAETKLAEQARIFLPLVAFALIFAMPIWSRSLDRFLKLLLSPFVLLPVGFCLVHLTLGWRRIARTKRQVRELDQLAAAAAKKFHEEY